MLTEKDIPLHYEFAGIKAAELVNNLHIASTTKGTSKVNIRARKEIRDISAQIHLSMVIADSKKDHTKFCHDIGYHGMDDIFKLPKPHVASKVVKRLEKARIGFERGDKYYDNAISLYTELDKLHHLYNSPPSEDMQTSSSTGSPRALEVLYSKVDEALLLLKPDYVEIGINHMLSARKNSATARDLKNKVVKSFERFCRAAHRSIEFKASNIDSINFASADISADTIVDDYAAGIKLKCEQTDGPVIELVTTTAVNAATFNSTACDVSTSVKAFSVLNDNVQSAA